VGETDDNDRWLPAAHALQVVSRHFSAVRSLEDMPANEQAAVAIIERLASGALVASPKGLLLQYATKGTDVHRWLYLWHTEPDGERSECVPREGNESSHLAIPVEFWRPFYRGDEGAVADWDTGDFRLANVCNSEGIWSGRARDVHFDQFDLPAAWLAQADVLTPTFGRKEQGSEEAEDTSPDAFRGSLPSIATNSDRRNEAAAHAAAEVVRDNRCRLAEAIRQVRHMVEEDNRDQESIDRAIRRSYRLMYDPHGFPIKN